NEQVVDKVTLIAECYDLIAQYGMDFIAELDVTGDVNNFEDYENKMIEQYKARRSHEIAKEYLSSTNDMQQLIDKLQSLSELNIVDEMDKNDVLKELANLPYMENDAGIKTNLKDLDAILGGFVDANSYILGARPSMGKTAVMLKFALSCIEQDIVPVMISLEMSKESLLKRMIATLDRKST